MSFDWVLSLKCFPKTYQRHMKINDSHRWHSFQSFFRISTMLSTLVNEAYDIIVTVNRMNRVLPTSAGFDLFSDHHNLIFRFHSVAVVPHLCKTGSRKFLNSEVCLSTCSYTCVHTKGLTSVWADLHECWDSPGPIRRLDRIPVLPSSSSSGFC